MISRYRNLFICSLLIGLFVCYADSSKCVFAELKYEWLKPEVNLNGYDDIYIYMIDVRNIKLEIFDDDEDEFITEPLSHDILEEIANRLHGRFINRLQTVFSINNNHEIDDSKKSLVVDIKLSAAFRFEDRGLLAKFLLGEQSYETDVFIECIVKDSQSGERIFLFEDSRPFEALPSTTPLESKDDLDSFEELLRIWARRFGNILEGQKNKKR
jgi:hypothetical protein